MLLLLLLLAIVLVSARNRARLGEKFATVIDRRYTRRQPPPRRFFFARASKALAFRALPRDRKRSA